MSFLRFNIFYFSVFCGIYVGWFVTFVYFFGSTVLFWFCFFLGHYLITLITATYLNLFDIYHDYKRFWIWFLILLPYFGFVCFLIYGQAYKLKKSLKFFFPKTKKLDELEDTTQSIQILNLARLPTHQRQIFNFVTKISKHPVYSDTDIKLLYNKYQKLKNLEKDFLNAQNYIYINYFVFVNGECFLWFCNLLKKVLKKNIKVYIIFDFFGKTFFNYHLKKLIKLGLKCGNLGKSVNMIHEIFYINHRKTIVVDGKIGYIGGFNIGDDYANLSSTYGFWLDMHVRLTGLAVKSLEIIFLKDWLYLTNQKLPYDQHKSIIMVKNKETPKLTNIIQFIDETPRTLNSHTKDLFFHLITHAQKRIYITTPFFYFDSELEKALCNAALSGVDVKIFLPEFTTWSFFVNFARLYYVPLLKVGIKIYELNNSYIHSKIILIDDDIATIGTCNFDYRSFYLSWEATLLLRDRKIVQELDDHFFKFNMPYFKPIKVNPLKKRNKLYVLFLKILKIGEMFY